MACIEYGNVAGTPGRELVSPEDSAGVLSHVLVSEGDRTEEQRDVWPWKTSQQQSWLSTEVVSLYDEVGVPTSTIQKHLLSTASDLVSTRGGTVGSAPIYPRCVCHSMKCTLHSDFQVFSVLVLSRISSRAQHGPPSCLLWLLVVTVPQSLVLTS